VVLLPFKTEYLLSPKTPTEVCAGLSKVTGPARGIFESANAEFSGPLDRNGFVFRLQELGRGPVVVCEGTLTEIPGGAGTMIRMAFRLSWVSLAVSLWVLVPTIAMNLMIVPGAALTGQWLWVCFPMLFLSVAYGITMIPFNLQRSRISKGLRDVVIHR